MPLAGLPPRVNTVASPPLGGLRARPDAPTPIPSSPRDPARRRRCCCPPRSGRAVRCPRAAPTPGRCSRRSTPAARVSSTPARPPSAPPRWSAWRRATSRSSQGRLGAVQAQADPWEARLAAHRADLRRRPRSRARAAPAGSCATAAARRHAALGLHDHAPGPRRRRPRLDELREPRRARDRSCAGPAAQRRRRSPPSATRGAQTRREARRLRRARPAPARARRSPPSASATRSPRSPRALEARRAALARVRDARLAARAPRRPSRRRAERELRRLESQRRQAISRPGPAARGRSRGRSCSASPAGRTRRRTPRAPPATTSSCPPPGAHRRQHPARLPGEQGRAGPPGRALVGRRRRRAQLGLRGPRRPPLSRRASRAHRWPVRPHHERHHHRRHRAHRHAPRRRAARARRRRHRPLPRRPSAPQAALGVPAHRLGPVARPGARRGARRARRASSTSRASPSPSAGTRPSRRRSATAARLGTRNLVAGLRAADPRPGVLVSASAVGFYGKHGDERVDENAAAGGDFLARRLRRLGARGAGGRRPRDARRR